MKPQLSVRMGSKPFDDEDEGLRTGKFDILAEGKVVARCLIALSHSSDSPLGLHINIAPLNSKQNFGFSSGQELSLDGPVAVAFLQLVSRAGSALFGGIGLDSPAAAFLAIASDDDESE